MERGQVDAYRYGHRIGSLSSAHSNSQGPRLPEGHYLWPTKLIGFWYISQRSRVSICHGVSREEHSSRAVLPGVNLPPPLASRVILSKLLISPSLNFLIYEMAIKCSKHVSSLSPPFTNYLLYARYPAKCMLPFNSHRTLWGEGYCIFIWLIGKLKYSEVNRL